MQGFPILLWDSMESCLEANRFFRSYLLRGAIGSKKSWPSTGRALYDYFSFLQAHDLAWDDVQRGEEKTLLAGYRDYCFAESRLARNTVRQRLMYVCEFYEFALREGWIEKLPFGHEERVAARSGSFLAHVDASSGQATVRDVMPRKHKTLPKFLMKDQVQSLMAAAKNPHHRMLIRVALQTGLRREELATFPLAYVFDPDKAGRRERNIRISLNPRDGHGIQTKGSKTRDIYISRRLLKDLHHYAVHLRGERASLSQARHMQLFLNHLGQPFADDGKGITQFVRDIGRSAGVSVHPHMLRHTYATHTLAALQRNRGDIRLEPLVFVQRQLGHASIQTTMIYLHLINELADNAVLAYDDELNNWIEAAP